MSNIIFDYLSEELLADLNEIRSSRKAVQRNNKRIWRILDTMDELEKNSFIKMFTDGWCSGCAFDSSKCAEQKMCEAYKIVNKSIDGKGDDNNG